MKGIGCCAPATKCFRPDVIHASGSAEDTVNCWFWGSSGIPPRRTPLKSSKYTLGSSWNLIVAGKKTISLLHTRTGIFLLFGWGRRGNADNSTVWALLFVTMAPQRRQPQRSRDEEAQCPPPVPLRDADTHSPGSSSIREPQPWPFPFSHQQH